MRGFLYFVEADRPPVGGSFSTRGVGVLWPKKLAWLTTAPGNLTEAQVCATHQRLAGAFPRA